MTHDELIEKTRAGLRWVLADIEPGTRVHELIDEEVEDLARAAIHVIAPAIERETLDRAATEAWSTMNGAVGLCECADCVSQNIRAMKTRYEQ